MSDLVSDINSFISLHNAARGGQQHASEALPTMLSDYYAPSLMIGDTDTNSSPTSSITSSSTYMSSCFDKPTSQPSSFHTRPSSTAFPESRPRIAPQPLICEFKGFGECDKVFQHSDEANWITHIAEEHLHNKFPLICVCWFCDREFRASSHSEADKEVCYRKRMHHIAKHLYKGLSGVHMRPDFFLLDHLHGNQLINEEQFHNAQKYHEVPQTLDFYPHGWRPDQHHSLGPGEGSWSRFLSSRSSSMARSSDRRYKCLVCNGYSAIRKDDLRRHQKGCRPKGEEGEKGTGPNPNSSDILAKNCKAGSNIGTENCPPEFGPITCSSGNSLSLNDSRGGKVPSHNTTSSSMVKLETNLHEEPTETFSMRCSPNYSQQHTLPILSKLPEDLKSSVSSQTRGSDGSSSVTETYIDERKTQIVDSLVSNVTQWLRSMLKSYRKNAGGDSGSVSGTQGESQRSCPRGNNPIPPSNQKRKLTQIDDGETDDDNEEGDKESRQGGKKPVRNNSSQKYACPYFKYNPTKYKEWRVCPGPGWVDIHRLKEHLYRRHRQPKYRCGRCWHPFKDEQCYMDHLRTEEACPLREMEHVEGLDAAQERSLKSRKRPDRELSEDDKWRRVFKILFPHVLDDDIPSPFYDYDQACQNEANHQRSESDYLAQCEDYMLREVPQRLRQALGRELDRDLTIVEESLRRKAGDWVKTLLEEAFRELRHNRGSGGQSQPNEEPGLPIAGPSIPAPQAGSSGSGNLSYEEQSETWLTNFNWDSLDPFTLLGDTELAFDNGGLLEDLLRPANGDDSETRKFSDSGYGSYGSTQFEK